MSILGAGRKLSLISEAIIVPSENKHVLWDLLWVSPLLVVLLFGEMHFCSWKWSLKPWLFFKGLWNKRRWIAGYPQLPAHYPRGNFWSGCVWEERFCCLVLPKGWMFSNVTFLCATGWPCRGNSQHYPPLQCSVLNCQYSCSDLSTVFNLRLKFIKPLSQKWFLMLFCKPIYQAEKQMVRLTWKKTQTDKILVYAA